MYTISVQCTLRRRTGTTVSSSRSPKGPSGSLRIYTRGLLLHFHLSRRSDAVLPPLHPSLWFMASVTFIVLVIPTKFGIKLLACVMNYISNLNQRTWFWVLIFPFNYLRGLGWVSHLTAQAWLALFTVGKMIQPLLGAVSDKWRILMKEIVSQTYNIIC